MTQHMAYPDTAHFGQEFALGVTPGLSGEPFPRHPRGQARAGSYVSGGRQRGTVQTKTFRYDVPDGTDPLFPTPVVGDRLYVTRWYPDEIFVGGWGFASGFSGLGDLKAEYVDSTGTKQTIVLASAAAMIANTDYNAFEAEWVNEANPTRITLDLFYELSEAPAVGEVLKGRLDFVTHQ